MAITPRVQPRFLSQIVDARRRPAIYLSRKVAEDERIARGLPSHVVVSITDPEGSPAALPEAFHRRGVLRLAFHDVERIFPGPPPALLFSEQMAYDVVEFVDRSSGLLVVAHCEAGISRSAAVAAAVCWAKNRRAVEQEIFECAHPNRLVYRRLLEAFEKARGR